MLVEKNNRIYYCTDTLKEGNVKEDVVFFAEHIINVVYKPEPETLKEGEKK